MLIGFVRHGLTDWNAQGKIQGQTDIPLNDEGRNQARLLGQRLQQEPHSWDFIVSSGLSRAEETAQIISSFIDVPLHAPDARLRERSYGQAEGLTAEQREERFGPDWSRRDVGQESDAALQERGLSFLKDMQDEHPDAHILVVSHGGFLAQLYKMICSDLQHERIGNLSLTIMESKGENWSPILYNCTRHLITSQS